VANTEHVERRTLNVNRQDGCDGADNGRQETHGELGTCRKVRGLGNANSARPQGRIERGEYPGKLPTWASSAWSNYEVLHMLDGKSRRIESGSFPLAHGIPGRVGLLRGYGNAIVPQVAAIFIQAFLDTQQSPATLTDL
jgi:DNA (cytosine-5)-methyltransferase 1